MYKPLLRERGSHNEKSIFCLLSLAMLFNFVSITVFADSSTKDTGVCGVYGEEELEYLTPEMQLNAIYSTLNAKSSDKTVDSSSRSSLIQTAQEMYDFMKLTESERTAIVKASMQSRLSTQSANTVNIMAAALPRYVERVNVPHYKQENSYYCGPATTKQTISFLSGGANNPSQTYIAGKIGTTTAGSSSTNMANWLRTQGYIFYSVPVSSMSYQDIENYVYSAIWGYRNPTFGGITVPSNNLGSWHYKTGGHILNISAIYYDGVSYHNDMFEFTDPYITWVKPSMTSGKYNISIYEYKRVMTSFWW